MTIPWRAAGRIQVRFPTPGARLPGRRHRAARPGTWRRRIPATSQPAYPASEVPAPPPLSRPVPRRVSAVPPPGTSRRGAAGRARRATTRRSTRRPAAPRHPGGRSAPGYVRMPYLADRQPAAGPQRLHRLLRLLPVTGCAAVARLFNDRCVTCGTSPRGRVADLTDGQLRRARRRTGPGLLQRDDHDRPLSRDLHAGRVRPGCPRSGGADTAALRPAPRRVRAKLTRIVRVGSLDAGLGPTALFPLRLRRPIAVACAA